MYCFTGTFAGAELLFAFHYRETAAFYGEALLPCSRGEHCIVIPSEDIALWQDRWRIPDPAYAEYVLSCSYAGDALMKENRAVFHGASFLWRNRAYLFSAPSGTGKTTQLRLWKSLYGSEMEILNGDKPILEVCQTGEILVHPSPWKGKENLGRDDIIAPLGGIIILRQDGQNSIVRVPPSEAAGKLFGRLYAAFSTEDDVLRAGRIMDHVFSRIPVWLLSNRGDEASAKLTYETLVREVSL